MWIKILFILDTKRQVIFLFEFTTHIFTALSPMEYRKTSLLNISNQVLVQLTKVFTINTKYTTGAHYCLSKLNDVWTISRHLEHSVSIFQKKLFRFFLTKYFHNLKSKWILNMGNTHWMKFVKFSQNFATLLSRLLWTKKNFWWFIPILIHYFGTA